jgi:hypothetical protein
VQTGGGGVDVDSCTVAGVVGVVGALDLSVIGGSISVRQVRGPAGFNACYIPHTYKNCGDSIL